MLARQHSFVVEEEHGFPRLPRPEGVKGQGFFVEIGFRDLAFIGEGVGVIQFNPRVVFRQLLLVVRVENQNLILLNTGEQYIMLHLVVEADDSHAATMKSIVDLALWPTYTLLPER